MAICLHGITIELKFQLYWPPSWRTLQFFTAVYFLLLWWFERISLTHGINLKQIDFGWNVVADLKAKKIIQLLVVLYSYIMKQVL